MKFIKVELEPTTEDVQIPSEEQPVEPFSPIKAPETNEFQREVEKHAKVNRCTKYNSDLEEESSEIGKYAYDKSTAAVLKKFGTKYDRLTASSVRTWRDRYRESLKYGPERAPAKLGRPLLIGEKVDEVVQKKIMIARESAEIVDRHTVQCLGIATMQFQREVEKHPKANRRIKYNSYSEEERSEIGKYDYDKSTAAALNK